MAKSMTTSSRILTLISNVPDDCKVVYDHCCDHGLIGLGIKNSRPNIKVILVDIVVGITNKLKDSYIPVGVSIIQEDSSKMKIESKNATHVIAGIGGELGTKIIANILSQDQNAIFVISVNKHTHKLRLYLMENNLKLHSEQLVQENNQFYEILTVSKNGNQNISPYGLDFWTDNLEVSLSYLKRLRKHLHYAQNKEYLFFVNQQISILES